MNITLDKPTLQANFAVPDEEIPILDLGPFLAGEDGAAEMHHTLGQIGFFYIINHSVPESLRDRMVAQTAASATYRLNRRCCLKSTSRVSAMFPTEANFRKPRRITPEQ